MRRRVGLLACLLPVLSLGWSLAGAAMTGPTEPLPAEKKEGPQVIAPADIPAQADVDERFAQDVVQRSRGRDPYAKLENRLEALSASVHRESQYFKRDELRLLSISRLESLERHWAFYERQLVDWRGDLKQASNPMKNIGSHQAFGGSGVE